MPACIFTSEHSEQNSPTALTRRFETRHIASRVWTFLAVAALYWVCSLQTIKAYASDDRTVQPEEDDYSTTPYTEYGDYEGEDDESEEIRFYQYGRLFGITLQVGQSGATGNRGLLWKGGFPALGIRTTYWFNFHFALDLVLLNMKQNYSYQQAQNGTVISTDVNMTEIGMDVKYYFDTRDSSAAITFANPFITAGVGNFTLTQTNNLDSSATFPKDASFGVSGGAGLEFALSPRKVYFNVTGTLYSVKFKDTNTTQFQNTVPSIPDQTGLFYSVMGGFLFTW